jgi:D-arabinose 1-dehydrogenase-like Zn-dependent alcohol dehydrogenase
MNTRYFHTYGDQKLQFFDNLEIDDTITDDEILIQTVLCGVCRSDIAAYASWEDQMPFLRQGHEGLGRVARVGSKLKNLIKEGDLVATWSDPAYCDFYKAKENEFVRVPEIDKKYILQPSACAVNIGRKCLQEYGNGYSPAILLIGSGFMSFVLFQYFKYHSIAMDIVGASLQPVWDEFDVKLKRFDDLDRKYDIVIDLSSKASNFDKCVEFAKEEGIICYAATPFTPVSTNFFDACWKCLKIIMPSPRNADFNTSMALTRDLIKTGIINVDKLWTKEYDRNSEEEVLQAFTDGVDRKNDYIRGYINWEKTKD